DRGGPGDGGGRRTDLGDQRGPAPGRQPPERQGGAQDQEQRQRRAEGEPRTPAQPAEERGDRRDRRGRRGAHPVPEGPVDLQRPAAVGAPAEMRPERGALGGREFVVDQRREQRFGLATVHGPAADERRRSLAPAAGGLY